MPSKAIRALAYDETRNELTVTFARGPTYVYSLVPAAVAAASPAMGVFHNEEVRERYPFRKIVAAPTTAPQVIGKPSLRDALAASMAADEAPPTPASGRSALQSGGNPGRG